jgi:hypothetical protein
MHDGNKIDIPQNSSEPDGWTYTVTATKYVCIQAYPPSIVFISVNGTSYGSISTFGANHAIIDTTGVPQNISSC